MEIWAQPAWMYPRFRESAPKLGHLFSAIYLPTLNTHRAPLPSQIGARTAVESRTTPAATDTCANTCVGLNSEIVL